MALTDTDRVNAVRRAIETYKEQAEVHREQDSSDYHRGVADLYDVVLYDLLWITGDDVTRERRDLNG